MVRVVVVVGRYLPKRIEEGRWVSRTSIVRGVTYNFFALGNNGEANVMIS
jgi:hypothetical protein